jgi:hypothetical protein
MATLADTLRKRQEKQLVRGPGGILSETSQPDTQQLAGQAGLVIPPTTPIGVAMIGGNPDQQKMAGTPAQLNAALNKARDAAAPESSLQTALRRQQVRTQATAQEAGKLQKSADMQALGGLGDRVTNFIDAQRQLLQEQGQEAATGGGVEVAAVDKFAETNLVPIKDKLKELRKNPNNMQLMLEIQQALGMDINKQLAPGEVEKLYEEAVSAIARGGAEVVDDALTVEDLLTQPDFGYDVNSLSELLGVPADQLVNYNLTQLRQQISAVADQEFAQTQQLAQQAGSTQLGVAERGLARQAGMEASRVGLRSTEADVARIEEQIQRADRVLFGGQEYSVDQLLQDETISKIINDYMKSGPDSEFRKIVERGEPGLINFIKQNEAVIADATEKLELGASEFKQIQDSNKELQSKPFGGIKLDDSLASQIIPGFGTLQAQRVDPNTVPLLKYVTSKGPQAGTAVASELNAAVQNNPTLTKQVPRLTEQQLTNLGIENGAGSLWAQAKSSDDTYKQIRNIAPSDTNALLQIKFGPGVSTQDIEKSLKKNRVSTVLGFGGGSGTEWVDPNGDGVPDWNGLQQKLLEENPPVDLGRVADTGQVPRVTRGAIRDAEIPQAGLDYDIYRILSPRSQNGVGIAEAGSAIEEYRKQTGSWQDAIKFGKRLVELSKKPGAVMPGAKESLNNAINDYTRDLIKQTFDGKGIKESGRFNKDGARIIRDQLLKQPDVDRGQLEDVMKKSAVEDFAMYFGRGIDQRMVDHYLHSNKDIVEMIFPGFQGLSYPQQQAVTNQLTHAMSQVVTYPNSDTKSRQMWDKLSSTGFNFYNGQDPVKSFKAALQTRGLPTTDKWRSY